MSGPAQRLDAFTDAAFAFALTLFVAGGEGVGVDMAALRKTVAAIPAFAIGFAIIGMFWYTHVRWRTMRGDGDWRSVLLTLALVFAVLGFVQPLRVMAASFADFLVGRSNGSAASLGEIFQVYGAGFVAMSLITLALLGDALRNPALKSPQRYEIRGELAIWTILAVTGVVSFILAATAGLENAAPTAYATLPVTIGLFSWWWYGKPRVAGPSRAEKRARR